MAEMRPAAEMKDSGIEWIGEIPKDWIAIQLKNVIDYNLSSLPENTAPDFEFDYIDIGSVTYGKGIEEYQRMKFIDAPTRARRIVNQDDVILSTVRTYLKAVAAIPYREVPVIVSTGFLTMTAKKRITPKFLFYTVQSDYFVDDIEANSNGISYPAINASSAVRRKIVLPPLSEQQAIADYLDDRCSKIDEIIAEATASIEEYKELKQAVIFEAVTKGLDKTVPMKDSGVEWIGEIPSSWAVKRFKYVASVKANLVSPEDYMDYKQIAPDCIEKDSGRLIKERTVSEAGVESWNQLFSKGQLIYSKIRPILNKVIIAPYDGLCSADMYPLDVAENTEFVQKAMLSRYFIDQVGLITQDRVKMPKINKDELANIYMAIPPLNEQARIVKYLDIRMAVLDGVISEKQSLISDLQAYKKSLIYEVVTGKRRVV